MRRLGWGIGLWLCVACSDESGQRIVGGTPREGGEDAGAADVGRGDARPLNEDAGAAADATGPAGDAAGDDAARPGDDAARPGDDAARPGDDAAPPGEDAAPPGEDAAPPGDDAAPPGDAASSDAARPDPDAAPPPPDAAPPPPDAAPPPPDAAPPPPDMGPQVPPGRVPCSRGPGLVLFAISWSGGGSSADVDRWDAPCDYSIRINDACGAFPRCGPGAIENCRVETVDNGQGLVIDGGDDLLVRFSVEGMFFQGADLYFQARALGAQAQMEIWSPIYGGLEGPIDGGNYQWYGVDWSELLRPGDEQGLTGIRFDATQGQVAIHAVEVCLRE